MSVIQQRAAMRGVAMACCVALISAASLVASLVASSGAALAQAPRHDDGRPCNEERAPSLETSILSFQLENDLFWGTDAQYTNGARIKWVSPNINSLNDPLLPMWVRCSNKRVQDLFGRLVSGDVTALNMVVTLGQAMYTPSDRDRTTVDPDDRPYAGWLYLGLGYNVRHDPDVEHQATRSRRLDTWEIDVGIVGPHAYAKVTQDFIHRARAIRRFDGWQNQLKDELGFQIVREQKVRPPWLSTADPADPGNGWAAEAIPHYGLSIGNIRSYLNAGVEFRAGWRLPDDFGTSPIRPGGDNAAPRRPRSRPGQEDSSDTTRDDRDATRNGKDEGPRIYAQHSFHLFASFDTRIVANNIFLDGNTFRHSHAIRKNILVGDVAFGFAYVWPRAAWRPGGKLAYAHYLQTPEFRTEQKTHGFGSVTVSLEF